MLFLYYWRHVSFSRCFDSIFPIKDYLYLKNNITRSEIIRTTVMAILLSTIAGILIVVHYKEKMWYGGYLCWRHSNATSETNTERMDIFRWKKLKNLSVSTQFNRSRYERTQIRWYLHVDYTDVFKSIVLLKCLSQSFLSNRDCFTVLIILFETEC